MADGDEWDGCLGDSMIRLPGMPQRFGPTGRYGMCAGSACECGGSEKAHPYMLQWGLGGRACFEKSDLRRSIVGHYVGKEGQYDFMFGKPGGTADDEVTIEGYVLESIRGLQLFFDVHSLVESVMGRRGNRTGRVYSEMLTHLRQFPSTAGGWSEYTVAPDDIARNNHPICSLDQVAVIFRAMEIETRTDKVRLLVARVANAVAHMQDFFDGTDGNALAKVVVCWRRVRER